MLFGLYEQEILEVVTSLPSRYRTLVDIGAADGYYAPGLVKSGLVDRSICFEITKSGQEVIAEVAARNGVSDRVKIFGAADASLVAKVQSCSVNFEECVVICDVEGEEFSLFTTEVLSTFRRSVVIIELHPEIAFETHDAVEALRIRASKYFSVSQFKTGPRDPARFSELQHLDDSSRWLLCSEGRPRVQFWFRLDPLK
jgi:hypothetical protein